MVVRPGYKRTEVGVIPEDWEVLALRRIASEIGDGIHATPIYSSTGEYFFINGNNLRDGRILISEETKLVGRSEYTKHRKNLGNGSILLSINGTIGNLGLYDGESVILGKSAAYLNVKDEVARSYVYYSIQTELVRRQFSDGLTGTTIKNLGLRTIRDTQIPLPPTNAEQRSIAGALSDVDALLDGLDRLIAKKRDLKQAAMQQLLTGQTRLPGFHGEWEWVQVQDVIASYFCGPSPTCEERNIQDEFEWGVLKTTAATVDNGWDWTKHKTLPRGYWNAPHLELKRGDVIVTKAGPRHRVGVPAWVDYVPPHIIVSGKMIGLRPRADKTVPMMLAAAISAREAQVFLDQRTTGMAESQVNFENSALLEAPIQIPRIDEQRAIANVCDDMDAELSALEARRNKTRHLKQAMMQELLSGKTRLVPTGDVHA